RSDYLPLLLGRKRLDHRVNRPLLADIDAVENATPVRRQPEDRLPSVGSRSRSREQTFLLELAKHAAEVRRVQRQRLAERSGGCLLAVTQLEEDADFGEREFAVEKVAIQRADLPRVEAVESAHARHVRVRWSRGHIDQSAIIS